MLLLHSAALTSLIFLFIVETQSSCLQTSFSSAVVRVCGTKCIEQTIRGCVDAESFIGDVMEVSFINTKVPHFRRAIFNNMPHLRSIQASTMRIERLYPDAFYNTPNVQTINLIFNHIQEIPWGVFNNMSTEEIVLSWNNLSYVEEEAFSNMPKLKTMLLNQNKLDTYDKGWFKGSTSLKTLNLSHNKISKLWFRSFDIFPSLTYLDLSFNNILEIGAQSFSKIKLLNLLDLTSNNLTAVSIDLFPDKLVIKELRVALNRLSFLSEELLERGSVQSITLSPNPWQCPCLDRVVIWAGKHNMVILQPNDDYRIDLNTDLPVCAFKEKNSEVCVLAYDEEFLSTQREYFKQVSYVNAVREKPTSEPPNFDVLNIDESVPPLSPL